MILIDGRRHRDNDEGGFAQARLVRGKFHGCPADGLIANFVGGIDARPIQRYLSRVEVIADNLHALLGKRDRQRHTDVTKPDDRELFVPLRKFLI